MQPESFKAGVEFERDILSYANDKWMVWTAFVFSQAGLRITLEPRARPRPRCRDNGAETRCIGFKNTAQRHGMPRFAFANPTQ